jgi:putative PIN family toxin of toxin-antitoxin system
MKIVLDTNVLVSGLLSPFGPPGEIVRMVSSGEPALCLDARVLSEYAEVLARPRFAFDQNAVDTLLDFISHAGQMVASAPLPLPLPDVDDQPFLEIAIAGQADFLVTGNMVHFPQSLCCGIAVVTPAEFITEYLERKYI